MAGLKVIGSVLASVTLYALAHTDRRERNSVVGSKPFLTFFCENGSCKAFDKTTDLQEIVEHFLDEKPFKL